MIGLPRLILIILAPLLFSLASPALARDCEAGAKGMAEVYSCLTDFNKQRLDTAYNETLRFVKRKDRKAADLLAKAQQSWTKFSFDSCDYAAVVSRDQIPAAAQTNCWAKFVDARIRVLEGYRRDLTSPPTK